MTGQLTTDATDTDPTDTDTDAVGSAPFSAIGDFHVDDLLEYVHAGTRNLPGYLALYRRYLRQRWNVYDLDFTRDRRDWLERLTEREREAFLAVASGFHHGERQVEVELPVFMLGGSEEEKIHIAAQIEDEARHTIFFDRFYREVVGVPGESILDVLDASYGYVSETFAGPFGLLAYQADDLRKDPENPARRVAYGTTYFLWIEGVLALTVMKVTLTFCRRHGVLPGYLTGFLATCRDEARHVQGGMRFLRDAVRGDPALLREVHETLRTILLMNGAVSRALDFEPLGWDREGVRAQMIDQLRRKLNDVGIRLPGELDSMVDGLRPELAGG
jgi:ribonucleoside-diphosphate reductase beta chain